MKSKILPGDFFCFLEMMRHNDVKLKMNVLTYKKIIGMTFGFTNYATITNVIPNINSVAIDFDPTMSNDIVKIFTKYIPHTSESIEIEII